MNIDETRRISCGLLSALSYLHRQRVVHRDVKPANIMLQCVGGQRGRIVKLAGFGMAVVCPRGGSLSGQGTFPYMPPEQLMGYCNEACDVWACGCILYEFLLGDGHLVPRGCWADT